MRVLITVFVLLIAGAGGWLLLGGEAAPVPPGREEGKTQQPVASVTEAPEITGSALRSQGFDERPRPLLEWVQELVDAKGEDEPRAILAARQVLRRAFRTADPEVLPQIFAKPDLEAAWPEILPLWIDMRGVPEIEWLRTLLAERDFAVRTATYLRLARLGAAGEEALVALLATEPDAALGGEALAWLLRAGGRAQVQAALGRAPGPEVRVQQAIAMALTDPTSPEAAATLRSLFHEDLPFRMREAVADALATTLAASERRRPTSKEELFARGASGDPIARALALREAGNFMDNWKRAQPEEEEILAVRDFLRRVVTTDPDPLARRAAVLSRVGLRPGITDLKTQCSVLLELAGQDRDAGVRAAVLLRIHRGCEHARPPFGPSYLKAYLDNDPDPEVRVQALRTLPRYLNTDWQEEARGMLRRTLFGDPDPGVRLEAAARLTELGFEAARGDLLAAAQGDTDPGFRRALFEAAQEQLAEEAPEFVRDLARAQGRPLDSLPTSDDLEGSPASGGLVLAAERPLGVMAVGSPFFAVEEVKASTTFEEPAASAPETPVARANSVLRLRWPGAESGIFLEATLIPGRRRTAPLLIVLPSEILELGTPSPISLEQLRDAAAATDHALLVLAWRGTGGSSGRAGGGEGERADLVRILDALGEGPWRLHGRVQPERRKWCLLGAAVPLVRDLLPEGEACLELEGVPAAPEGTRALHRWCLKAPAVAQDSTVLLEWLREN